jgi:hypothetical protein
VFTVTIGKLSKDFFVGEKMVKGPSLDKILTKSAAFPAATNVIRFLEFTALSILFLKEYFVAPLTIFIF